MISKSPRKRRLERGLQSTIFVFLILVLAQISLVSAMEWDNKLTYLNNDLKVEFTNLFGLGSKIGEAELKSHKSVNEIKRVGQGNQVVMYYDFNFADTYEDGLGKVYFIDMKTGKEIQKDYNFVYWGDVTVNDYELVCDENLKSKGEMIYCEEVLAGSHKEKKWLQYDSTTIPKGDIRIGLQVYVDKNEYVDGQWTLVGKKIEKHAKWITDLNTDLVAYYSLNGTAGDVIDVHNGNDGTNQGATRGVAGKLNNSFSFDGSDYVDIGDTANFTDAPFTINMWVYPDSTIDYYDGFIGGGSGAGSGCWAWYMDDEGDLVF